MLKNLESIEGACHSRQQPRRSARQTHAPQQTTCTSCNDLLDHFLCARKQRRPDVEAEHPAGLGVNQFELGRLHYR